MTIARLNRSSLRLFLFLVLLFLPVLLPAATEPQVIPEVTCPSCEDSDPCTLGYCDWNSGTCWQRPRCDDGDPCTADTCDPVTWACTHTPVICDDQNPCTIDTCTNRLGSALCSHANAPDGAACDDGSPCTVGDACSAALGPISQCAGQNQPAGTGCDDGNSCTSQDACDGGGRCGGIPSEPGHPCDDRSLCTSHDACALSANGSIACQGTQESCADQDPCTQDLCDAATGSCTHPPLSCEDGNDCTLDSCDPDTGACEHANYPPNMFRCNDGNFCTEWESCRDGTCQGGGPNPCDDNVQCTHDSCDSELGRCVHTPDRSLCPADGECYNLICDPAYPGGGPVPAPRGCRPYFHNNSCRSTNPCLFAQCYGLTCERLYLDGMRCDDHDPCTTDDTCMGNCRGRPLCWDSNPCTTDICDPVTLACSYANTTGNWCTDGNSCTDPDVCGDGVCQSGPLYSCDDGNKCTTDVCTGYGNCAHRDACDDRNVCTLDLCDPPTGECSHQPTSGSCDDHNRCTRGDQCVDGICQPGRVTCAYDECCYDGNDCTLDVCDAQGYCSHQPRTGDCSDGDYCTIGDACVNGICQSGTTVLHCDDGNPCTRDFCSPPTCGLAYVYCDDRDPCTVDSCDPAVGCVYSPETTCGTGICQRTVDTCLDGVPQTCVPGSPAQEVCNGLDDDCDGLVDEVGMRADCILNPTTLNLGSKGDMVSMTCKLFDVCDPANPVPIPGESVSQVYVSRLDSADSSSDDVRLPDPSTLPCPGPGQGMNYERGISENLAARDISNANVTFKFNQPSDGDCSTLDGDRQDIAGRLTSIPDNTSATLCIVGKTGEKNFEACMLMLVRNKGLR